MDAIIDPESVEAGSPCRALDGWNDGAVPGELHQLFDAADEPAADVAFMHEAVALPQLALRCELRHARAGAGAAGAAIDSALAATRRSMVPLLEIPLGRPRPPSWSEAPAYFCGMGIAAGGAADCAMISCVTSRPPRKFTHSDWIV